MDKKKKKQKKKKRSNDDRRLEHSRLKQYKKVEEENKTHTYI